MALNLGDPRPSYVQLADLLRRAITDGTYKAGDRLPAVRKLAVDHGVAYATAAKSVDVLQREGIVISRPGLGTVVREVDAAAAPLSIQDQLDDLRSRVERLEQQVAKA